MMRSRSALASPPGNSRHIIYSWLCQHCEPSVSRLHDTLILQCITSKRQDRDFQPDVYSTVRDVFSPREWPILERKQGGVLTSTVLLHYPFTGTSPTFGTTHWVTAKICLPDCVLSRATSLSMFDVSPNLRMNALDSQLAFGASQGSLWWISELVS